MALRPIQLVLGIYLIVFTADARSASSAEIPAHSWSGETGKPKD